MPRVSHWELSTRECDSLWWLRGLRDLRTEIATAYGGGRNVLSRNCLAERELVIAHTCLRYERKFLPLWQIASWLICRFVKLKIASAAHEQMNPIAMLADLKCRNRRQYQCLDDIGRCRVASFEIYLQPVLVIFSENSSHSSWLYFTDGSFSSIIWPRLSLTYLIIVWNITVVNFIVYRINIRFNTLIFFVCKC